VLGGQKKGVTNVANRSALRLACPVLGGVGTVGRQGKRGARPGGAGSRVKKRGGVGSCVNGFGEYAKEGSFKGGGSRTFDKLRRSAERWVDSRGRGKMWGGAGTKESEPAGKSQKIAQKVKGEFGEKGVLTHHERNRGHTPPPPAAGGGRNSYRRRVGNFSTIS